MFIIARVLGPILLSTCFVKSLRNTHRTHAEYDWSVYLLAFRLYANFIDFEYPIDICFEIVVWKFKTARWSEVSRCLENDSKLYQI